MKKKQELVSIITPVYNSEEFIEETIKANETLKSFFENCYIRKTIEYCDGGYVQGDGMYFDANAELCRKENSNEH